jgi:hypothetical protein
LGVYKTDVIYRKHPKASGFQNGLRKTIPTAISFLHSFIQTLRMQATEQPIDFHEILMPAVDTP